MTKLVRQNARTQLTVCTIIDEYSGSTYPALARALHEDHGPHARQRATK